MLELYMFQILNGLGLGMIYFLIAVGLTIIFGLLNFVNFAHGAFFLLGQVLNAREKFGPMMWAPIANNVVQIAVLGLYAVIWGQGVDTSAPFTSGQALLLGGGSTLGIVAQTHDCRGKTKEGTFPREGFKHPFQFTQRHTPLVSTTYC